MAERSGFFNALETEQGEYDRTYNAEDFSKLIKQVVPSGIYVTDEEAEQEVIDNTTVTGLKPVIIGNNIVISPGKAIVDGYWYENTSNLLIPFPTIGTKKLVLLSYVAKDRKVYANLADWDGSDDSITLRKTDDFYDILLGTFVYDSSTTKITDKREQFITTSFKIIQNKFNEVEKKAEQTYQEAVEKLEEAESNVTNYFNGRFFVVQGEKTGIKSDSEASVTVTVGTTTQIPDTSKLQAIFLGQDQRVRSESASGSINEDYKGVYNNYIFSEPAGYDNEYVESRHTPFVNSISKSGSNVQATIKLKPCATAYDLSLYVDIKYRIVFMLLP